MTATQPLAFCLSNSERMKGRHLLSPSLVVRAEWERRIMAIPGEGPLNGSVQQESVVILVCSSFGGL